MKRRGQNTGFFVEVDPESSRVNRVEILARNETEELVVRETLYRIRKPTFFGRILNLFDK